MNYKKIVIDTIEERLFRDAMLRNNTDPCIIVHPLNDVFDLSDSCPGVSPPRNRKEQRSQKKSS